MIVATVRGNDTRQTVRASQLFVRYVLRICQSLKAPARKMHSLFAADLLINETTAI